MRPLAAQVHADLTRDQRVGQLFMGATPVDRVSAAFGSVVRDEHVGNAVLTGRSTRGADHVRSVTTEVQQLTEPRDVTGGVPALIAADHEDGRARVLHGPGFTELPSALEQETQEAEVLRRAAHRSGAQLSRSGVNTVLGPQESGTHQGSAVRQGMTRARIATTAKHFPGPDASLAPFARAVEEGCPLVMVSSTTHTQIDGTQPAVFSPTVIGSLLRGRLGFAGIVMSDDVGDATALEDWPPGERATQFIDAGGDMVLTVNTGTLPEMVAAVRQKAGSDADFATKVDAASLRVLEAKEEANLLEPRTTPTGSYSPWTTKRLQTWLGLKETGVLGPETVGALQYRTGAPTTGTWDARSFRALQVYLGLEPDGTTSWDERTTTRLQRYLNTQP